MEVSEEEVMKPDDNHKRSLSMSSDTFLLEKTRKLLRGNNTESSQSCSINSPLWINSQLALSVQSTHRLENRLEVQSQPRPLAYGEAESSISVTGCNQIEHFNKNFEDYQDVTPEFELGGPPDDDCSWRKYGQKDVLVNKNPRLITGDRWKKREADLVEGELPGWPVITGKTTKAWEQEEEDGLWWWVCD
ncbi:hypothetical protein ACH5RR_038332 [Cinchona calisaya]|uniref:WRKY domain-containing protein n=1 Tax=Cinchona calisaya TaxID=153742 RepID=A0ABD2XYF0_9GENT